MNNQIKEYQEERETFVEQPQQPSTEIGNEADTEEENYSSPTFPCVTLPRRNYCADTTAHDTTAHDCCAH